MDNSDLYRALGFKVPIEGLTDDNQTCQVLECANVAAHSMFFQHKDAPVDLRLFLCTEHHDEVAGPKPVAVRALVPEMHLDSIPVSHRDKMKAALSGQIAGYMLEQFMRPRPDAEIQWDWHWIDYTDGRSGQRIYGTELIGSLEVERVELHAPTP